MTSRKAAKNAELLQWEITVLGVVCDSNECNAWVVKMKIVFEIGYRIDELVKSRN